MGGWASVFGLRQRAKNSLLLVPMLGGVIGVAVGEACVRLESVVQFPERWHYTDGVAQDILTAIVGAMVGLLGLVVAVGLLVVQVATGSLSPRCMRLWYRDRLQKSVLATFVGTTLLALWLLHWVQPHDVPNLGVTMAGAAVAVSLALLLLYLNRFLHTLRPVGMADRVARWGLEEVHRVTALARRYHAEASPADLPTGEPTTLVRARRGGVIQSVHLHRLIALAERHDCVLVLTSSFGDFIAGGEPLIGVHADGSAPRERSLLAQIALGDERSIEDDPGFAMRVLVDIAIRALPPSVNDPTTAVQILDHIELLLFALAHAGDTGGRLALQDQRGRLRVVMPIRSFAEYLQVAVTEIRQYGAGLTQVARRLTAMLEGVREFAGPEHRPLIEAELARLRRTSEASFSDAEDLEFASQGDRQGIGGSPEPPGEGRVIA